MATRAQGEETIRKLRAFEGRTIREAARALNRGTDQIARLGKKHDINLLMYETDRLPRERSKSGRLKIRIEVVTPEFLREWINYDPLTGVFTWRKCLGKRQRIGQVTGCPGTGGYVYIGFFGIVFSGHRLAWFYVHGKWPCHLIDHKDGDTSNNAFANLREATPLQSARNRLAKGYTFDKRDRNFKAVICVEGRGIKLGSFDSKDDARTAYLAATEKYFGNFSVVRSRGITEHV